MTDHSFDNTSQPCLKKKMMQSKKRIFDNVKADSMNVSTTHAQNPISISGSPNRLTKNYSTNGVPQNLIMNRNSDQMSGNIHNIDASKQIQYDLTKSNNTNHNKQNFSSTMDNKISNFLLSEKQETRD